MVLGRTVSQADVNNTAATITANLLAALDDVAKFKATLDSYSVADLEGMGFTTAEANGLKSAFADLGNLAAIARGEAPSGTMPRDHGVFAKRLLGLSLY